MSRVQKAGAPHVYIFWYPIFSHGSFHDCFPQNIFRLTKWKMTGKATPSKRIMIHIRFGGVVFLIVGAIALKYGLITQ